MNSRPALAPQEVDTWLRSLGIVVLERGWLSSNNVVLLADDGAAIVDTGYATHAAFTVELVRRALGTRPLRHILNTHLHSDHCGGNAALQAAWPDAVISIPPGLAEAVRAWDRVALTHEPTGQECPRFTANRLLTPGETFTHGGLSWDVHVADGHDPHAVVLFERSQGILMSADALWGNGFGVVFPELEGESGFAEVSATLDLIEQLAPKVVIPGHGPVFYGASVGEAMRKARSRLAQFEADPRRHRQHALKVLIKFKLLEWQQVAHRDLLAWFAQSRYFARIANADSREPLSEVLDGLLDELEQSNALRREGAFVLNT
jgi:glyoxylase-like metal-dependent hydrolase (beta-lactamase superfamily II)